MTKVKLIAFEPRKIDWEKWRKADSWPDGAVDAADGLEMLVYLMTRDRLYSITELSIIAQARFCLSREHRVKTQFVTHLKRIHKKWSMHESARGTGEGADVAAQDADDAADVWREVVPDVFSVPDAAAVALAGQLEVERAVVAGGVAGKKLRVKKGAAGAA